LIFVLSKILKIKKESSLVYWCPDVSLNVVSFESKIPSRSKHDPHSQNFTSQLTNYGTRAPWTVNLLSLKKSVHAGPGPRYSAITTSYPDQYRLFSEARDICQWDWLGSIAASQIELADLAILYYRPSHRSTSQQTVYLGLISDTRYLPSPNLRLLVGTKYIDMPL